MDEERRNDIFEENESGTYTPKEEPPVEVEAQPIEEKPFYNESPKSQYPPNVGTNQRTYNGPYGYNANNNTSYYANDVKPPKKKKNIGLIVFLSALAVTVLIAITAIIGVQVGKSLAEEIIANGGTTEQGENDTTVNNGPELEIQDNGTVKPEDDVEIKEGKVLTATQIASKADKISVGVLVYSDNTNKLAGEGTGILMSVDADGKYTYVITCAHVVDNAGKNIIVQTNTGETFDAELVGLDTRTDIGVLRIKTNKLECATFGNSDNLKVGDTVYAIGNPGGTEFFGSFTSGMVSAIDRSVNSEIGYSMECIQHTAAINPGNSGGALLNSYGQVIGINSSKIIAAEFEGMGFSIPISDAKEIVDNLIKHGRITNRAKLGISYYTAASSEKYSMVIQLKDLPAGSLIIGRINADSDLADKDIMINDIITEVNGKPLTTSSVLLEKVENGKIGDVLTLTIVRFDSNYKMKTFDVKVKLVADDGKVEKTVEESTTYEFYNPFN
ncbi:MAG: trypsin-like peptidase domain-containing protein [Clostridia bacterium]|nr:trypsin-like peptidase domain-containing protein [Clostridia bacterium]